MSAPLEDSEAEVAVLCAMMLDRGAIVPARDRLRDTMFASSAHRSIFNAILEVSDRSNAVDPVTLAGELHRLGQLEAIGGKPYLCDVFSAVPTSANVEYHAQIVRELAQRREAIRLGKEFAKRLTDRQVPLLETAEEVAASLARLVVETRELNGRTSPFLTADEVSLLEPPRYLVDGLIPDGALTEIHGPPASGKSFFALALACDVATGHPFLGRPVRPGPVLYVAGEGVSGLGARLRAWQEERGFSRVDGLYFLREPIHLLERAAITHFLSQVRTLARTPVLIVLDTLARCMVGGDENSAQDMGLAMDAASRIARETGAAILLLHHTRKDGDSERGSTALRGAIDTMIAIKNESGRLRISCEKMKDGGAFESFDAALRSSGESCTIVPSSARESSSEKFTPAHSKLLLSLSDFQHAGGGTDASWKDAAEVKGGAFYRYRKDLMTWGYIKLDKPGRGGRYTLTPLGEDRITPRSPIAPRSLPGSDRRITPSSTPSQGGGE